MIPQLPPMDARVPAGAIPDWDLSDLAHRACPVCLADSPVPMVMRPDGLTVHRCRACEFLYLADVPTAVQIERFYSRYSDFKRLAPRRRNWLANWFRCRTDPYIGILEETGGLAGRRVVDVGCAFGDFLQSARGSGAIGYGVDLDDAPLRFVESLGMPTASDIRRFSERFDVVTSFQVLEHLADPNQFLSDIADRMTVDGRLLVAVPNGGDAEVVGGGWVGFRVDLEHFNYYTVAALSRLLMRHGFYVEAHWEYYQPQVPRHEASVQSESILRRAWRRCVQRGIAAVYPESRMAFHGAFVMAILARYARLPSAVRQAA